MLNRGGQRKGIDLVNTLTEAVALGRNHLGYEAFGTALVNIRLTEADGLMLAASVNPEL
jgi:hypothetical protein